ncbi:MAG: hypothetical protein F4Y81_11305 [Rhodothermaceae bacterium]|nr:hypothetical protein [Bacteroidota bacterium]MXW15410.1 hypothetical protein [Rhodothermaceae bacterium]MXW33127.1 hypothetical protein [Rhodothermaceae bacterium]MXZ18792.1 hypothetical protein [Rhodothermaceae bacterium]MYC04707.1 hypothetical protein [Rhodothermaceae bacterium]
MKKYIGWMALLVCLAISIGSLGTIKKIADAKQQSTAGCGLCIVYDRESGETESYPYVDPESDLKPDGCACSCR